VFLAGRTLARLDRVADEISAAGGSAETAEVDALDEKAVEEHAGAVAAPADGIDVTLNAIGVPHDFGYGVTCAAVRGLFERPRARTRP
jgi:NADP-dependent 3-hydroxy acid dehydrogenase YdfG